MTMRAAGPATGPPPDDDPPHVQAADLTDALVGPVADEAVQVEAAESELRRLGLEEIRVRHHGDLARLEAPHGDLAGLASEPLRGEILRAVRSAGFRSVAVDLETVDPGAVDPGAVDRGAVDRAAGAEDLTDGAVGPHAG